MNETIKYQYEENNDVYVVEIQETGVERTVDGITVREIFEIFEDEVNDFDEEKLQDMEIIREMIDVVCAITHTKQYIVQLALMVYGILPITPKNTFKGDIMEISKLYDVIEETIDKELKEYKNTFFEIFDDEITSDGRIYINTNTDEDDVLPIVKKVLNQFPMVKVEIEEAPSVTLGYYYYGFTISIVMDFDEIEAFENDEAYHKVCKEQQQDEEDMDCVFFGEDVEGNTTIDYIKYNDYENGDFYSTASGGAFSSSADYWSYILG